MKLLRPAGHFAASLSRARLPLHLHDRMAARRLRGVVAHAWEISPWYRDRWSASEVLSVHGVDDLHRLPVLEKADVATHLTDLMDTSLSPSSLTEQWTSGSTGAPLRVVFDARAELAVGASWMRAHLAYGFGPLDRMAYFRFGAGPKDRMDRLGLFRSTFVSPRQPIDDRLNEVERVRPHVVAGYPSHLLDLVEGAPTERLRGLGVRTVVAGSETLTPDDRTRIEQAFGCPVRDLYGCFEFGNVAFECSQGGRHLNTDMVAVEVVDDDGNPVPTGQTGDLVLTGLWNRALPLVRYRIGDRGSLADGRCPCGRTLPLLASLDGRRADRLVGVAGRHLSQAGVGEVMKRIHGVRRFRVTQAATGQLAVELVLAPGTDLEGVRGDVAQRLQRQLGSLPIVTTSVAALEPGPSGKVRPVVTAVPMSATGSASGDRWLSPKVGRLPS